MAFRFNRKKVRRIIGYDDRVGYIRYKRIGLTNNYISETACEMGPDMKFRRKTITGKTAALSGYVPVYAN